MQISSLLGGKIKKQKAAKKGELLSAVVQLLRGSAVEGIAVRVGVGRFSDTRTLITTANALSYAWGVPVITVSPDYDIDEKIEAAVLGSKKKYAGATYSAPPHITRKKDMNNISVH